jgi:diacylglycerol kinase
MAEPYRKMRRSWIAKFAAAFGAVAAAMREQSSFWVHLTAAALVFAAAAALRVSFVDWCLLVLCVTMVFSAEMMNTALEHLAKAIDAHVNPHLARGLDTASGAVLLASLGAVAVGAIVLLRAW